jgi:predicted enzyme related to lactoylglutathione lyase
MANPVIHFEVVGRDLEKLQSFYGEVFGWKMQAMPEMGYAMIEKEGDGIAGGLGQTDDGSGHVTFYVSTEDPQAILDKVESLGGKTVMPVTEMPMVTLALFADPEGHVVGIVKSS